MAKKQKIEDQIDRIEHERRKEMDAIVKVLDFLLRIAHTLAEGEPVEAKDIRILRALVTQQSAATPADVGEKIARGIVGDAIWRDLLEADADPVSRWKEMRK